MSIRDDIGDIKEEFPDTPNRRLSDDYHYQKLRLAEAVLLPKIEKGELLAIQTLLKFISEAVNDGARINKKIANYLAKALFDIYKGEKADLAFGITRVRGQKNTRMSSQKNFSIAFFIEEREIGTLEDRFYDAAKEFNVSYDTAKKAWFKNYKKARELVELNKKYFFKVI